MKRHLLSALGLIGSLYVVTPAHAQTVFATGFEAGGLPFQFFASGASIQGTSGYAALGTAGNQFGNSMLRYDANYLIDTTLTITDLPPHDTLTLGFLLAIIDSWDGTELFQVLVDDNLLFSHTFNLAGADTSDYTPPDGGLLSSGTNLGFTSGTYHDHDRAYDMSLEPAFIGIPHTASSVTIAWRVIANEGSTAETWQGGFDESWGIDNVVVSVESPLITTTSTSFTTTTVIDPTTTSTETTITTTTTDTIVPPSSTTTTLPAQMLSGKKLLLKWKDGDPKKSGIDLLSRDKAVTLGGGPDSDDDPTVHGGSLRVFATGGDAFDVTYELPAAQWQAMGKKAKSGGGGGPYATPAGTVSGWKLKKTGPFSSLQVKAGKQIKIVGHGDGLDMSLANDPKPVLVELRLGGARYCMGFGGTVKFTAGKKYQAKNSATTDAACPP